MSNEELGKKTVDMLNAAFQADPGAIHSLMRNHVECNEQLADDPFIPVEGSNFLPGGRRWFVSALGLINGVLAANGLPKVGRRFDSEDGDEMTTGFQVWTDDTEVAEETPDVV